MMKRLMLFAALLTAAAVLPAQSSADFYAEGRNLYRNGRIEEARAKFEASAKAAESEGNRKALCDAHLGIAMMDQTVYAYESALGHYLKVKELAEALDYQGPLSSYYNNVAVIYKYQGRIDDAIALYRKSLEIRIGLAGADSPLAAVVHNNLGVLYDERNDRESAKRHLDLALKIREERLGPMDLDTAITYMNYASYLEKDSSGLEQAYDYYRKALKAYMNQLPSDHPSIARVYEGIAGILGGITLGSSPLAGRSQEAEEYFYKTLAIYKARGWDDGYLAAAIYNKLGDLQARRGNYAEAVKLCGKAVANFEACRDKIGLDSKTKATYLVRIVTAYKSLAGYFLELKDHASAFYYLELAKSRSLLDDLSKNAVFYSPEIGPALKKTFEDLKRKAGVYEQAIAEKQRIGKPSADEDMELAKIGREYEARLKDLYAKYPRYKSFLEPKILTAKEAQCLLDDSTVLVEYGKSGNGLLIFVLTKTGLEAKHVSAWDLEAQVKALRDWVLNGPEAPEGSRGITIEGPGKPETMPASQAKEDPRRSLYKMLLEPIAGSLKGAKRVVIVPDGELAFVPFELLKDEKGRCFIEERDVAYVQSASLAGRLARPLGVKKYPFVAFGGALYQAAGGADKSRGAKPSAVAAESARKSVSGDRGMSVLEDANQSLGEVYANLGYTFKNLPGTSVEVRAAGELFYPKADERSQHLYLGPEVREERIKELGKGEKLADYRIVHFATHGLVNPEYPALSALVVGQKEALAAAGVRQTKEDGYLNMGEIVSLKLEADLVTLSACETGLGKLLDGEGVVGLTQSFLLAGAKNVAVSLWSVSDEATKEFMIRFYGKVKQGKSYGAALSEVKREFLKGRFDKPFYWAPFVLYGAL